MTIYSPLQANRIACALFGTTCSQLQLNGQQVYYDQLTSYFNTHPTAWASYYSYCQQYPNDDRPLVNGSGGSVEDGCNYYRYVLQSSGTSMKE